MQTDPEKISFGEGQKEKPVLPETEVERKKEQEKSESSFGGKATREELEKAAIALDQNPVVVEEAKKRAATAAAASSNKTIDNLIAAAKEKGVVFAVRVAKEMNDPFLLDTLHDRLVQEGMLKDFS